MAPSYTFQVTLLIDAHADWQAEKRATCVVGLTYWYSRLAAQSLGITHLESMERGWGQVLVIERHLPDGDQL